MRKLLLMSAATLGLAAGPALAQTAPATPPVMPPAAPDAAAPAARGMTGMRPLRGQQREAVGMQTDGTHRVTPFSAKPGSARRAPASQAQDAGIDAPRTGDYRGGAGSPSSTKASNIGRQDTRSDIAPRLPDPGGANTPQALLQAAQRALASNRTGAAQEALERAETRVLTRSTDPSAAGTPDSGSMVQSIGAARRALAARDIPGARAAISAALAGS